MRPERTAMIEIIRAYARSEASVLGPQGISERHRANRSRSVHPRPFVLSRIQGRVGSHWRGPDNIAAVHSRTDDPSRCDQVRRHHPGSWHGFRLPGCSTGASGAEGLYLVPSLADAAANVLKELGYENVSVKVGDGYNGWSECGPFDAVIVTAALGHVPPPLIEQLKVGGRLITPWGLPRRHSS
jgi:protein-L-isoaspartate(D-aspartate) O-methyltransferase